MRNVPLRVGLLLVFLCGALTVSSCGYCAVEETRAIRSLLEPLLPLEPAYVDGTGGIDLTGDWYAPAEGLYLHLTSEGTAALISADGCGLTRGRWELTENWLTMLSEEDVILTGSFETVSEYMFLWECGDTDSVFVQVDWYLSQRGK